MTKKIRIGTFRCWLFGHKFIVKYKREDDVKLGYTSHYSSVRDYCVRCGILKSELKHD